MARVLTRPMFRKGGLSRETGIMSGLDRKGYAQGSYAPRVGYQKGSVWNPLNWFKRGVPVRQFGPVTGSYYQTHTMAPESAYSRLAKLKRFTGSGISSLAGYTPAGMAAPIAGPALGIGAAVASPFVAH